MTIPGELAPLSHYQREALAFLASKNYLLSAEILSRSEPSSPFASIHNLFASKIPESYGDPATYVLSCLFVSYIASFEAFLQDTAALVLRRYPKKLGSANFTLAEVIDANDPSTLIERAIENSLDKMMYKKPLEYFPQLCQLLSIESEPLKEDWKVFVEAKARRDLGVHSAWRCNALYLSKTREAKIETAACVGDTMLPSSSEYLDTLEHKLSDLALNLTSSVAKVHWPHIVPFRKDANEPE
jgi:hypothetical protein